MRGIALAILFFALVYDSNDSFTRGFHALAIGTIFAAVVVLCAALMCIVVGL